MLKGSAGTNLAAMAIIFVMLPVSCLPCMKNMGSPCEVVVRNTGFRQKFTRPKERHFTENRKPIRCLGKAAKTEKEVSAIRQKDKQKRRGKPQETGVSLTRARKETDCRSYPKGEGGRQRPHRTADHSLPCHVPGRYLQGYGKEILKCVVFEDINYQLSQADDKTAIFENWCDFLNYFDASVSVQLSFINQGTRQQAEKAITIPAQGALLTLSAPSIRIC